MRRHPEPMDDGSAIAFAYVGATSTAFSAATGQDTNEVKKGGMRGRALTGIRSATKSNGMQH